MAGVAGQTSVIATGVFTDGGSIPPRHGVHIGNGTRLMTVGTMKLGLGTIRLTTSLAPGGSVQSPGTCLFSTSAHGTYTLGRGTGQYVGIRGSGRFSSTSRVVLRREANGECIGRHPLATQVVVMLSGPVTLGH
jgi:hypothetical protein